MCQYWRLDPLLQLQRLYRANRTSFGPELDVVVPSRLSKLRYAEKKPNEVQKAECPALMCGLEYSLPNLWLRLFADKILAS
jgi:hypothetical protein